MTQQWISVSAENGVRKSDGWDALMAQVAADQLARREAALPALADPPVTHTRKGATDE